MEPQFFETNATPGVVGQPLSRVDGWAKVTGRAKYSAEYNQLLGLVHVDPELGTIRVTRWVSVMSAGRILNPKTARLQVLGGSIFGGIGAALMEHSVRDPHLARYANADLANYHVPVNADIPAMTVDFIDEHDPYVNVMGVKGIGEISIVGVTAAVANAVFHATGRRRRSLPMTPDKVLAALRQPPGACFVTEGVASRYFRNRSNKPLLRLINT